MIDTDKKAAVYKEVDPTLSFHIGAIYLTGKSRKVLNGVAPVGTVGSFLFYVNKKKLISCSFPADHRHKAYEGLYVP